MPAPARTPSPIQSAALALMFLLTAVAWALTWLQVRNMAPMMRFGVPMSLGMEGAAGWISLGLFLGMWLIMMVAMMLPSTYPTLMLHQKVFRSRHPGVRGGSLLFGAGYFLAWGLAGIPFYAAFVLVGSYRISTPESGNLILRTAGLALVVAGLYQWSPLKSACLRHCQSPLDFLGRHWREGRWGALRLGGFHGLYCLGCCWGLMLILAVMGLMHLAWMAAIAVIILVEKVVPWRWIPPAVGGFFVVIGFLIMLDPSLLRSVSSQVTVF